MYRACKVNLTIPKRQSLTLVTKTILCFLCAQTLKSSLKQTNLPIASNKLISEEMSPAIGTRYRHKTIIKIIKTKITIRRQGQCRDMALIFSPLETSHPSFMSSKRSCWRKQHRVVMVIKRILRHREGTKESKKVTFRRIVEARIIL